MRLFDKWFQSKKITSNKISLFLGTDFTKCIEAEDQTLEQYLSSNSADSHQYVFLLVKNKKNQIILKRKLNRFQRFGQALQGFDPQHKAYLVIGYNNGLRSEGDRTMPAMNTVESDGSKIIRSGILYKFSERLKSYEECQIKLHQDYLMYTKINRRDKLSLVPLQFSTVQLVDQDKFIFKIEDKFKTVMLKSLSKEDMRGWFRSITEAIKIKNDQRYVIGLTSNIEKHQQQKIKQYAQQSQNLLKNPNGLLQDERGRRALKEYFQKKQKQGQEPDPDVKNLAVINKFHHYCKLLKEQDSEAPLVLEALKTDLAELQKEGQLSDISQHDMNSIPPSEIYKIFEQLSSIMSQKYQPILLNGKQLHGIILKSAVNSYKQQQRLKLSTLLPSK